MKSRKQKNISLNPLKLDRIHFSIVLAIIPVILVNYGSVASGDGSLSFADKGEVYLLGILCFNELFKKIKQEFDS